MRATFAGWGGALALAAAAALAGCGGYGDGYPLAPRSQQSALDSGFVEKRLDDTHYRISYYGPEVYTRQTYEKRLQRAENSALQTTYDLALWRAAQLSLQKGHKAFTAEVTHSDLKRYIVGRDYTIAPASSADHVIINHPGYYSGTYYRPEVTLDVELREADGEEDALAAEKVVADMSEKYADLDGDAIAPATYYYYGPPAFLHTPRSTNEAAGPREPPEPVDPKRSVLPYGYGQ